MSNSNTTAKNVFVLGAPVERRLRLKGNWLNIFDVTVPPCGGTPRHSHASPEVFTITEGRLRIWQMTATGPLEIEAVAGDIVTIPAHVPHSYSNPGQTPTVFSAVVDNEMAEFFEAVRASASTEKSRSDAVAAFVATATEHGIKILAA